MKLVDANVLLYAVNEDEPKHELAQTWLDGLLNGNETIAFAWVALLAFLRLATREGLFPRPLSGAAAAELVEAWTTQPASVIVAPTPRHLALLRELLTATGTGGNLVNDAHLAALSLEHGATIISFDSDFARFSGVRWELPQA